MKKQISLVMLMFLFSVCAIAAPSGPLVVDLKEGNAPKSLYLRLGNLQDKVTQITIMDNVGKAWFGESIRNVGVYSKMFHLAELPSGAYFLKVNHPADEVMYGFTISDRSVQVFKSSSAIAGDGQFVRNVSRGGASTVGNFILNVTPKAGPGIELQMANLQHEETVIEFGSYQQPKWMSETIKASNGYAKEWKLNGLRDGNYYFLIKRAQQHVIQEFQIRKGQVLIGRRHLQAVANGQP